MNPDRWQQLKELFVAARKGTRRSEPLSSMIPAAATESEKGSRGASGQLFATVFWRSRPGRLCPNYLKMKRPKRRSAASWGLMPSAEKSGEAEWGLCIWPTTRGWTGRSRSKCWRPIHQGCAATGASEKGSARGCKAFAPRHRHGIFARRVRRQRLYRFGICEGPTLRQIMSRGQTHL